MEIACKLDNWEMLCAHLSISSAEQAEVKKNHQGDYRLQKIQALKLWKHKLGRMATYEHLVGIIKKLGSISLAEDILHLALESYKGLCHYNYVCVTIMCRSKPIMPKNVSLAFFTGSRKYIILSCMSFRRFT